MGVGEGVEWCCRQYDGWTFPSYKDKHVIYRLHIDLIIIMESILLKVMEAWLLIVNISLE